MRKIQFIVTLFLCVSIAGMAGKKTSTKQIALVFIGNSITQGALIKNPAQDAPPVKAAEYLRAQPGIASVQFANCGVSGCTTVDYLPASATLFPNAIAEADKLLANTSAQLVFSVMLGTNDSAVKGPNGAPVSAVQYETNMKVIIDQLLSRYPECRVVTHRPLWYSPNTYNSAMYLLEGLNRLQSYLPRIEKLVADYARTNPKRVFMGDRDGYDYFSLNYLTDVVPEEGNAGTFFLHPNEKGAAKLGELWGKALYSQLNY